MSKSRTITLTKQSPVRIDEDAWPVVAVATWHNGQYEFQANYIQEARVRAHADGRRIVYAVSTSGGGGAPMDFIGRRTGELLAAGDDVVESIRRVCKDAGVEEHLAGELIADLPAEDLA